MILCSQAKLENDNRGINVKRGQRAKAEIGFRPTMAPLGYLNDYYSGKGQKRIFQDKERAPIIKEMFEKVAYENYSGRKIYNWLKDETSLRSRKGKVMGLSVIYEMLNNTYYFGMFEFPVGSGKWYKGGYKPIVSRELFDAVQKKMMIPRKPKQGAKVFDYTKLLKCGSCGSGITAQEKFKRLRSGKQNRYVYYHCTKFYDFECPEPYIREKDLIKEFIGIIKNVSVSKISSKPTLKPELDKYMLIHRSMQNQNDAELDEYFDLTGFIEYIFRDGSRKQKRDLISCTEAELYLENRTLTTKES